MPRIAEWVNVKNGDTLHIQKAPLFTGGYTYYVNFVSKDYTDKKDNKRYSLYKSSEDFATEAEAITKAEEIKDREGKENWEEVKEKIRN